MRIGIVRSDIGKLYLNDVENTSQRNFSSQPKGQSRYFSKPSDAQLTAMLETVAFLTVSGSTAGATFNTTGANGTKLNIRTAALQPFTQVTVPSGAAVPIASIVAALNIGFKNVSLGLNARADLTNHVYIDSTVAGPNAYVEISAISPSAGALQTVLGFAAPVGGPGPFLGLDITILKSVVYPTAVTIDVSSASVISLSTFLFMTTAQQKAVLSAVADLVAPRLVETGFALRSFAYGTLSKIVSPLFQPGGARIGLPIGIGAAIVKDDGTTVFSL